MDETSHIALGRAIAPAAELPSNADLMKAFRESRKGAGQFPLFRTFLVRVMNHLGFAKATRAQLDLADYLQFGPSSTIIQAFRGVGKSFVTSAFVLWTLLNDPQQKVMIVSASKQRADDFSQFVKKLIEGMPECAHLKADKDQRYSNIAFDVGPARPDQSPSVKSVGITGQITGSRADLIIADDIEIPKNSFTAIQRERIGELVKEFDNVIKPLPHARIVYLGTPQTEQSLYNVLTRERGYSIRIWPAQVPANPGLYNGNLAPMVTDMIARGCKAGTAVDPERFDREYLIKKRFSLGESTYTLQFMLDTTLSDADAYPLKLEDLIVMGLDPTQGPISLAYGRDPRYVCNDLQPVGFNGDYYYSPMFVDKAFAPWQGCVMSIDPSGRGKDELAYVVLKTLHGRLFLAASGGMQGGATPENLQALADLMKLHKANAYTVESNFGDGMFGQLLQPYVTKTWPCSYHETLARGQKEKRIIETLEPIMQQHRLVVDRSVIEADLKAKPAHSLFFQMTRITKVAKCLQFDDRLDALEMAVAYFLKQMNVDEAKAAEDHVQSLLDDELEAFIAGELLVTDRVRTIWANGDNRANWMGHETRILGTRH